MNRILVLYGTNHGHTATIAWQVAKRLNADGMDADVIHAGKFDPQPDDYAGVIVAASVRAGTYQRAVTRWVRDHAEALSRRPSMFLSVCLGVLDADPKVRQYVSTGIRRWLDEAGWNPTFAVPVAGALPYTKYNWFIRQIMKRIVRKAGGTTDTTRDHVFTDWAEVRRLTDQFAQRVRGAGTSRVPDVA